MAYDQKCYDLAEAFLSDVQNPVKHKDAHKLAQDIQCVIEDYLNEVEERMIPPPQDDEIPPALQSAVDREIQTALRRGKGWDQFFDTLLSPKVTK